MGVGTYLELQVVEIVQKKGEKMKDKIGQVAGDIWHILKERKEVPVSQLPKILNERSMIVNQALGWLARENKLDFKMTVRKMLISLLGEEK